MRGNKYRAWHKALEKYLEPHEWHNYGPSLIGGVLSSDLHDIEQFTGLLDKNGKEIYEGDIVVSGGGDRNFKIEQHKSSYCLYVAKGNHVGWLDEQPLDEIKVIGNIHEHSDLLKGEQQ